MRLRSVTESRTCQTHFSLTVRDGLQQCIERDWWTRTTLTPISGRSSPSTNCLKAAPVIIGDSSIPFVALDLLDWLVRAGGNMGEMAISGQHRIDCNVSGGRNKE